MINANRKFTDTDVRVNCRLSYAHVFAPWARNDGDPKYQATLLIDKEDKQAVELVNDAVEAAKKLFVDKFGKTTGKLKTTVYDGDEDFPDDPNCVGKLVVRASSKKQPGLKVLDSGMLVDALDEDDIYSGCFAAVEVNFFPYNQASGKGISAGLNNVLKLEDGTRLGGGGRSADSAFADLV